MLRYWPRVDECSNDRRTIAAQTLTLQDTQGTFLLLLIGVALAGAVLMTEVVFKNYAEHMDTMKGSQLQTFY